MPDGNVECAQYEATRHRYALRLQAAAARVLGDVPGARLARDSAGRHRYRDRPHRIRAARAAAIDCVLAVLRSEGMNASVSSIHGNGWFGSHDKTSGARQIVERLYGRRLCDEIDRWVYVGDSTNDQAMFAAFERSDGVASLMDFADRLTVWPAFISRGTRGAGFAEVADALVVQSRGEPLALTTPMHLEGLFNFIFDVHSRNRSSKQRE